MAKRPKLPTGYFWRGPVIWCRTDPVTKKQVSTGLKSTKGLAAWERKRETEAEDPRYAAAHKATLGHWVTEILEIKRVDKSAATVKVYQQKLGHFVRIWGEGMPLIDITPTACDAYTKKRRTEAGDHTITKEFSALSQMLKAAKRAGCYPHDISTLRPPTVAPRYVPRERHLTIVELCALRLELDPKLDAIVVVAVTTGARLSEALKFSQSDLRDWVAHLRGTKTEKSDRLIPVLARFRPMLESVLPELPVGEYKNNLCRNLGRACKRAGIPRCTPNDLRRTHASLLIAGGVDKEIVRRMLGHSTSRMVEMVYGKLDPKELEKLAESGSSALQLTDGNATINATVIDTTGDQVETQPNSGANSEGRTRDLRFTKPNTHGQETPETAVIAYNGDTARHRETPRDAGTTATDSATVDLTVALGLIRDLIDAAQRLEDALEGVSTRARVIARADLVGTVRGARALIGDGRRAG